MGSEANSKIKSLFMSEEALYQNFQLA